jgi:hypothetical protein
MNQDVLKDLDLELNDKNKLQDLIINKYLTKTASR